MSHHGGTTSHTLHGLLTPTFCLLSPETFHSSMGTTKVNNKRAAELLRAALAARQPAEAGDSATNTASAGAPGSNSGPHAPGDAWRVQAGTTLAGESVALRRCAADALRRQCEAEPQKPHGCCLIISEQPVPGVPELRDEQQLALPRGAELHKTSGDMGLAGGGSGSTDKQAAVSRVFLSSHELQLPASGQVRPKQHCGSSCLQCFTSWRRLPSGHS